MNIVRLKVQVAQFAYS